MIRSMTGFGSAEAHAEQWKLRAEARTVNHKELQLSPRLPEAFHLKEFELQKVVEKKIRRGHMYLTVTCRPAEEAGATLVDEAMLRGYLATLKRLAGSEGLAAQVELGSLLRIPGALMDVTTDEALRDRLWPHVVAVTEAAVDELVAMRRAEGANLWRELHEVCNSISNLVESVAGAQSDMVVAYQERLKERIDKLLAGADVHLDEESLAREVALFADRADISEEVARLRSHLEQFRQALDGDESPVGRRMEFIGQEMLREASTMAAKIPSGVQVRQVLDLKNEVERLREQVRNVE